MHYNHDLLEIIPQTKSFIKDLIIGQVSRIALALCWLGIKYILNPKRILIINFYD